jgi:hypothetical protein
MYDLATIKFINSDEQIRIRHAKARILNRASKKTKR